jgi:hypothetical protein
MTDPHQLNSIIATAICDACKVHPDHRINPEEAKQISKCIVEELTDAGLEIVAGEHQGGRACPEISRKVKR